MSQPEKLRRALLALEEAAVAFGQAVGSVADALSESEEAATKPAPAPTSKRKKAPTLLDDTEPAPPSRESRPTPLVAEEPARGGARRKILVALAQYGRPMSKTQIALYAGLSATSGGLSQALADLRADGAITGPGSANTITSAGYTELGDWARLPEGNALFEFWCSKMGGAAEKVLRVLRRSQEPMSKSAVATAAGLSNTSGGLSQALADLRKMQLIEGGGQAMYLSALLRRAIEPTIGVHNKSSGTSVLVDARAGHVRR